MLRTLGVRRRPLYAPHICALTSAVLLLFSVSLLYSRLSSNDTVSGYHHNQYDYGLDTIQQNRLLSDTEDGSDSSFVDRIDELDFVVEERINEDGGAEQDLVTRRKKTSTSAYYVDHTTGVIRRGLSKQSIEEWDYDYSGADSFGQVLSRHDGTESFGSDDVPIDEKVRMKLDSVETIEDALLLKAGTANRGGLRDGWGDWFDKKGAFLRRDRMFRSNLEALNPLNNPMLQDPDGVGITSLTRGDKTLRKWLLDQIRKATPLVNKKRPVKGTRKEVDEERRVLHRKLYSVRSLSDKIVSEGLVGNGDRRSLAVKRVSLQIKGGQKIRNYPRKVKHRHAVGSKWGYFPGLDSRLSFSEFVELFFKGGNCSLRVFMVWNSPSWMFGVRHQRGIESLVSMHRDACVLLLSETLELDYFKDTFQKNGYKVAVAMPNLDEILKDTPTNIFSSVWYKWRKEKIYPIHYSELIRLAVLYKYGGIYLDSDVLVLNPLMSLDDTIGQSNPYTDISLNGAVMAFKKGSPFLLGCLKEFSSTYEPALVTWNGADLLTRVARNLSTEIGSFRKIGLVVQPSHVFFPISKEDILRYFSSPESELEKIEQDLALEKLINQSLAFHFWNGLTSSLVPEAGSLVTRLLDRSCIYCHDRL